MHSDRSHRRVYRRDQTGWLPNPGDIVELRRWGITLRRGTVEAVMPDRSGFWLAARGVDERAFIHHAYDDLEIWS